MNERASSVPIQPPGFAGQKRPREVVLSAISELADHVRAYGLDQADDLLTELLALLHAEDDFRPAARRTDADGRWGMPNGF